MKNSVLNVKVVLCLIFASMFLLLFVQFSNVMIYYDDYAYYSLSYAEGYNHSGNTFSCSELLLFLKHHYSDCNGRILYFFIWLFTYLLGGLQLVQLIAAISITVLLFCLWKFVAKGKNEIAAAILMCSFFGLFSITIHRQGTYWFAAFFLYIVPLIPLVVFWNTYFKYRQTKLTFGHYFGLSILIFLAAFSQEQISVATFCMSCILLIYEKKNKSLQPINFLLVFVSVLGLAVIMLSPGIQERGNGYDIPLVHLLLRSTEEVIRMFLGSDMKALLFLLFLSVLGINIYLVKNDSRRIKLFDTLCIASSLVCMVFYSNIGKFNSIIQFVLKSKVGLFFSIVLILEIIIQVSRYYIKLECFSNLIAFYTAVLSVACLCVVPELPIRLLIPTWFLLFPFLTDGIFAYERMFAIKSKSFSRIYVVGICSIIFLFSILNFEQIYRGYKRNAEIHKYNDAVLRIAAYKEQLGQVEEKLYLRKVPDILYGCEMVYYEGFDYMKPWIDNYYGLSSGPEFVFTESGFPAGNTLGTSIKLSGYYEDGWVRKDSSFLIKSGVDGKVVITGYYPGELCGEELLTCVVGGVPVAHQITDERFSVIVACEPNSEIKIELHSNFELDTELKNEDLRELSFIIVAMDGM